MGGIMISVLAPIATERGFESLSGQTDYEIGICWFSAKHAVLRSKNKDLSAQNLVSASIRELLFQWEYHKYPT